jgi:hypothetical protein
MSLWNFHEAYKDLEVKSFYWYPNKFLIGWLDCIPKFDGDPLSAAAHVIEFTEFVLALFIEHEDVAIRLFLLSLQEKQREWI